MRWLLLLLLALLAGAAQAQASDAASRAEQEKQAKHQLDDVRTRIKALTDAQRTTRSERTAAVQALREQELEIAAIAHQLRDLDREIDGQRAKLAVLEERRGALATALSTQRDGLAALLRSAYELGRNEELKLLLQQEQVEAVTRVLAYHRYFQRARVAGIDRLLSDLQQLADVQQAIEQQTTQLQETREQHAGETARLDAERAARETLLAELDGTLKDQGTRIAALGKDEIALTGLLEKLRDVFADIPKAIAGGEPFASLRGRLAWPAAGKVKTGFGVADASGRTSAGLLIAAPSGTTVHAVSHGRVAFADWLAGYGMLIILDHGDSYMSLYGYNESLLKDVGDWVASGEAIATSGASGGQRSPGVYFELRRQGQPLNPRPWLQ